MKQDPPKKVAKDVGLSLALLCLLIVWSTSAIIGAMYWWAQNALLHIALSVLIPGYGIVSVLIDSGR